MVVLGGWVILMSEVPLYGASASRLLGRPDSLRIFSVNLSGAKVISNEEGLSQSQ